jgi:hypothetical protein
MALAMVPAGSSRPIEKIVPGPLCFDAHFGAPLPPAPGAAPPPPRPPPLGTPLPSSIHTPPVICAKRAVYKTSAFYGFKPQLILLSYDVSGNN